MTLGDTTALWFTTVVFVLTYLGLAIGKVPGLGLDRTTIALVGAVAMLVSGMISFDAAVAADSIDYRTLALLFGMMIVIAYLRVSGCFEHLVQFALRQIRSPWGLLASVIALAGTLSAFLINDVVCLSMTAIVVHLARRLRTDPLPHLIALATAANIGSTATITGNPQNIFIGSHSGIAYARFALELMPVAAIGLVLNFAVVAIIYRKRLEMSHDLGSHDALDAVPAGDTSAPSEAPELIWLRRKSVAVSLAAIVLFFAGLPLELVALGAAAVLLIGKTDPVRILREVDWSLLVLFAGLFVVVHAFQTRVVSTWHVDQWNWLVESPVVRLSLVSAVLSNLVSNVPAVLLLEPIVEAVTESSREAGWLALAMSSTLAGNLTIVGSIANLIVVENARREGVAISLWEYCRVGIPLTLVSLACGILWLHWTL